MKLFSILLLTLLFFCGKISTSYAVEVQDIADKNSINFTSCLAPIGKVVADYSDGSHGIVGMGNKIGKDTVYSLENGNAMQCFCSAEGNGIQTNWLKTAGYTEDEIKVMQAQGWIYVPTGAAWGLADEPYLAQNIEYSCKSSSSSNGGGASTTNGGNAEAVIQPAIGNLASTGNLLFIAEVFGIGILLTVVGLVLHFRSK